MADSEFPSTQADLNYPPPSFTYFSDYTFDREFHVVTTNTIETDEWVTSVLCNNPLTDERLFEGIVEMVYSSSEELARLTHKNLFTKWDVLATNKDPIWLGSEHPEDVLGIGEGLY